jgi:hypothetical protein
MHVAVRNEIHVVMSGLMAADTHAIFKLSKRLSNYFKFSTLVENLES